MEDTKTIFPQRLKMLRESMGWSMNIFAQKIGMTQPTISLYERGDRIPSIDVLDTICKKTNCDPLYLLGYSPAIKADNASQVAQTGLSEGAIETLRCINDDNRNLISRAIESGLFAEWIIAAYFSLRLRHYRDIERRDERERATEQMAQQMHDLTVKTLETDIMAFIFGPELQEDKFSDLDQEFIQQILLGGKDMYELIMSRSHNPNENVRKRKEDQTNETSD